MEEPQLLEKPDPLQEKIIEAAYDFAETLRSDIDPMLDKDTNIKVCRTLTVGAAKLLESIGHKPVIKVKLNKRGWVYHYFLEDPDLGIAMDFSPIAHRVGFTEIGFQESDEVTNLLARETLVIPLDSQEYAVLENNGTSEIREKGITDTPGGKREAYAWDHIHLDKMPQTIREKLEVLK
ncbi:MAG: hypothetical protein Q7S79_00400 [bacterium]|nr:hypothetical protein [bacterium]